MRWRRLRSWPLPMTASIGSSCARRTRIWRSACAATASFSSTGARARCATNRWCGKNSGSHPRRFPIGWRSWATARMATLVCPAGAPDLPRPCSPAISTSSRFPSWPRSGTCPCAGRCGWPRRSWNNASASCSSGSLPRCARTRPSAPTWTRCAGWDRGPGSRRGRSDSARRRYTSAPRCWRSQVPATSWLRGPSGTVALITRSPKRTSCFSTSTITGVCGARLMAFWSHSRSA